MVAPVKSQSPGRQGGSGQKALIFGPRHMLGPALKMQGNYTTLTHPPRAPRTPAFPLSAKDRVAQE